MFHEHKLQHKLFIICFQWAVHILNASMFLWGQAVSALESMSVSVTLNLYTCMCNVGPFKLIHERGKHSHENFDTSCRVACELFTSKYWSVWPSILSPARLNLIFLMRRAVPKDKIREEQTSKSFHDSLPSKSLPGPLCTLQSVCSCGKALLSVRFWLWQWKWHRGDCHWSSTSLMWVHTMHLLYGGKLTRTGREDN